MPFVGEAWIRLTAKTEKWVKGIDKAMDSIERMRNETLRLSQDLSRAGRTMAIAGGAMTAVAGLGVKAFASFERQLAFVNTMLDESTEHFMPEYERALMDMAAEVGEGTGALADGLYQILSASIDASGALDVLKVSAIAAKGGLTGTGVAADAITTILNSYALSADRAEWVSDVLFATVKRGKTTFAELAPSIGKVAATASVAGLSFEELGAAIATVTRGGLSTDLAITALNSTIAIFLKPTKPAIAAAKEFGLELSSNTLKSIGLMGAIQKLNEASAEQLAVIIPNRRAFRGMAVALKDMQGYQEDVAFMTSAAGRSMEAYGKISETVTERLARFGQVVKNMSREFGKNLMPLFSKMIDLLEGTAAAFNRLSPGVKKFLAVGTALTGVFLTLTGVMILFGAQLGMFIVALPAMKIAFVGVIGSIKGATIAMKGFFISMGPIGWAIAAAAALAAGLVILARRHKDLNEAVNKTSDAIEAARKTWIEYFKILKQSEVGVRLAEVAFKAQARMAEGNRLLAISAHGSAAEIREAMEATGLVVGFWTRTNRKRLEQYAKFEVDIGEKLLAAAQVRADKEIVLIKERVVVAEEVVEKIRKLTKEEIALMDEAYGYREGQVALEIRLLDRWYEEQASKYQEHEESMLALIETYKGRKLEIWKAGEEEMRELEHEALGYREGERAEELARLDFWYQKVQDQFRDNQEALTVIEEVYAGRRAAIEEESLTSFEERFKEVTDTMESSMASAFVGLADGTKTLGEAMTDFITDITRALTEMAAKMAAQQIMTGIMGGAGGGGGIGGMLASLFAGGGAAVPMQAGGIVTKPTRALLGEAGPEAVIPLDQMGAPVTVNFNVSAIDAQNTYRFILNNKEALASAVQGAMTGNHPLRRR